MGMQAIAGDRGIELGIHLYTDSSAAKGIASRRGLGKMRHVEVNQLWFQDKVHEAIITVNKIAGMSNQVHIPHQSCYCKGIGEILAGIGASPQKGAHNLTSSLSSKVSSA